MIDGIKDALNNKFFTQFEIKDKSILTEDSNKKMQAFKGKNNEIFR